MKNGVTIAGNLDNSRMIVPIQLNKRIIEILGSLSIRSQTGTNERKMRRKPEGMHLFKGNLRKKAHTTMTLPEVAHILTWSKKHLFV